MDIKKILKENKKSGTPDRIEIFSYMEQKHLFTANDLVLAFPHIGRASIFRTINIFLKIGVLRKLGLGEKGESYEISSSEDHHEHMKCESCGKIISFDSQQICKSIFEEAQKLNFQIFQHYVGIFGKCNECKKC